MEPRVDIVDTGSDYRILLAVPGSHDEDIEVSSGPQAGTISIKAQVRRGATPEGKMVMDEGASRQAREHKRILPVAWDADVEAAKTSLDAGVLTIVVPKKDAPQKKEREARGETTPRPKQ